MRSSEWLVFAYSVALAVMAWVRPLPRGRRAQITAIGLVMGAVALALPHTGGGGVRDWAPAVCILVGYYQSGRFFVTSSPTLEAWLLGWDRRLLGDPTTRFAHWPRPARALLEIVYMGCFLLVPAGFAALVVTGHATMADRYWALVIAAEFGAFFPLTVVQTRPPWAIERRATHRAGAIDRLAAQAVDHFTIRVNTFPSGHVAGSLAVALAVASVLPWAGVPFFAGAVTVSLACVVGRYHYIGDVVAGAALALAAWVIVRVAGL